MAAPSAEPAPPLLRNALVPISLVLSFALVYWAHVPIAITVLVIAPLLVLFALAPLWAVSSTRAFDRDALRLRASGRASELRARFDRAIGMRLFAAPAIRAERLGDVLRELGDAPGAHRAYARALETSGARPTLQALLGFAHAAYAAGEHAQAIGGYRQVLEIDATIPRVRLRLAHALLRRNERQDVSDAIDELERVRAVSDEERVELALLRAYVEARKGRANEARRLFASSAPMPSAATLRAEVEALIGTRSEAVLASAPASEPASASESASASVSASDGPARGAKTAAKKRKKRKR